MADQLAPQGRHGLWKARTLMGPDSAHFTEVGNGTIDWRGVLALAQKLEVEHYFVEQDKTDGPPMESVRASYNYLRKILA